jgi:Ca2+:H+ antiporter
VGIALGSASQIALFVAPALVLLSYLMGPSPLTLQFWPGGGGDDADRSHDRVARDQQRRSAWFVGVLVIMVYLIFAMTLYLLPPRGSVTP